MKLFASFHFHNKNGFTLIEILMVIVLIGILSGVAITQFINFGDDARIATTTQKLNEFKRAIVGDSRQVANGKFLSPGFEAHMNGLPSSLTDLATQGAQANYDPFTKTGWRGPYISNTDADWNNDAWGNAIQYSSGARTLTSYGPDGASGGGDDIVVSF
ncbi:MAG: prepilin-type N-terminal cleavage/methylation domain-containing protein [Bdellovibrionales bacterium]